MDAHEITTLMADMKKERMLHEAAIFAASSEEEKDALTLAYIEKARAAARRMEDANGKGSR